LLAGDASKSVYGYTGRDAFFVFRNNIMRYKDKSGWEKKEMRVYDLADEQAYKCVLLDFTVDRSSDQPVHRYPFTISLFVYQRLDQVVPVLKVIKIGKEPFSALDSSDSFLDKMEQLYKDLESVGNNVALLKAKSLELRTKFAKFLSRTSNIITSPLDIAKNLVDTAKVAMSSITQLREAGKITTDRYVNALEMYRSILIEGLKIYGYQISEGWQVSKILTLPGDAGLNTPIDILTPISRSVNLQTYEFSGLVVYTVRGEDSLQSIAQSQLGNVDLWPYIASVNAGIDSSADLIVGEEIFIPVTTDISNGTNKEQFILTEDVARDPYGSDILLDSDGNIVIQENSDFALVSGLSNVQQAIDLRLNTQVGSMIKQSVYGIAAQAGFAGTTMAIRYLKLSIRSALIQDPRIESIDNMIVSLGSDVLNISMNITPVGTESSLPISVSL